MLLNPSDQAADRLRDCLDILDAMSVLPDQALYEAAYSYFTDDEAVALVQRYGTFVTDWQGFADRMNRIACHAITNRAATAL